MKFSRTFVVFWIACSSLFYGTFSATNFKPHFTNTNPVISIAENTNKNTVVYVLTATDNENDAITYSLDDTGKELFDVVKIDNNKANLSLKADLNRELTSSYTFKAFVTDNPSDASKTGEKIFYVTVLDVNDNAPIFTEQPYLKSIPVNTTVGTQLLTIQAVDADSAANGAVQYRFSNDSSLTDKFEINNVNGHITLIAPLDFETSRYVLSVIAEDRGVPIQKSKTTVVIDVTDISDMPPKFERSIYITDINENSPKGTSVIKVVARDMDIKVNNPIKYEIYQGNQGGSFTIDASSGIITVNGTIDAEKIQYYTLHIRAFEVPHPNTNTTVKVLITVLDKNDNPPILSQASYYFAVREDQAVPGGLVTNELVVTDADKRFDFRRFTYAITGGDSSKFTIDPKSGDLKINSILDYETQINYTFTIVVTETGTAEKFSDNATVLLTLINANDNDPKFQKPSYNYSFNEEVFAGKTIAVIMATDNDLGTFGKISYYLNGDDAEYFQVDSNTGNITTAKTLYYKNKQTYQFRLHARDGGGIDYREGVVTINVVLKGVTDDHPTLTNNSGKYSQVPVIVLGVFFAVSLVFILILVGYIAWKHRKGKKEKRKISPDNDSGSLPMDNVPLQNEVSSDVAQYDDVVNSQEQHQPSTQTHHSVHIPADAYTSLSPNTKLPPRPADISNNGVYQDLQEVSHQYQSIT